MKSMYLGFAAILAIAIAAYFGLNMLGFSAAEQGAGQNVRLY